MDPANSGETRASGILEALESRLAYLPGGRDREERPFVVVNIPLELQPTTKPNLENLLRYFLSIFSEETKQNGLTLILNARIGAWRVTRSCIRQSMALLGPTAKSVIVIRPDGFWDKRVDNCTKYRKEGEPVYIPLMKLHTYVETTQLPYDLGGTKPYDHSIWIQTRMRIEEFTKDAADLVTKLRNLQERLDDLINKRRPKVDEPKEDLESCWESGRKLSSVSKDVLQAGRNLEKALSRDFTQNVLDSLKKINDLMDSIELKELEIENSWIVMERSLNAAREINDLEEGVSSVTNWILGPADSMLNSRCQVGFDVTSSEELRRQHEKLELECRETYGRYAELLHKIDNVPCNNLPEDLKSQRDFMDFVCRSFATRLERRRNVLITSQRFFRLVSEYFDKTSEVFDKLVMAGNRARDFSLASEKLGKLEKSQATLEFLERELVKEGEKLSDILSMPVKDALGREVPVDYGEDIVNVRDILDATNARKNIFNDSVELQKLTLKQMTLIHTYEGEAEQAIRWLTDLFNVLIRNHVEIGCNATEIQSQKEEHQCFQDTAKGTFDYGCQLVNGARVLRMSCRLPLDTNTNLSSRLRQIWKELRLVGQEQLTRLRVSAVFHRNVEDHCKKLGEMIAAVRYLPTCQVSEKRRCKVEMRDILSKRETLLLEVGRMVRLGRLLRGRLREALYHQRVSENSGTGRNLTAIEAISLKLTEVMNLAEELDEKLYEAGAKTRPATIPPNNNNNNNNNINNNNNNNSIKNNNNSVHANVATASSSSSSTASSSSKTSLPYCSCTEDPSPIDEGNCRIAENADSPIAIAISTATSTFTIPNPSIFQEDPPENGMQRDPEGNSSIAAIGDTLDSSGDEFQRNFDEKEDISKGSSSSDLGSNNDVARNGPSAAASGASDREEEFSAIMEKNDTLKFREEDYSTPEVDDSGIETTPKKEKHGFEDGEIQDLISDSTISNNNNNNNNDSNASDKNHDDNNNCESNGIDKSESHGYHECTLRRKHAAELAAVALVNENRRFPPFTNPS